jgi:hypothetical protein
MPFFDIEFGLLTSDVVGLTEAQRDAVELQAAISIVDEATWLYKNFKHPRFENFYGYAQIMHGAYVAEDIPLQFLNQTLLYWYQNQIVLENYNFSTTKIILNAINPSFEFGGDVQPVRQPVTSIRFRLLAGVKANLSLSWYVFTPDNATVKPPAPEQGRPHTPNNTSSNPAARPGDQGRDPSDPSANDGNYNPNEPYPHPPTPGGGGNGMWHAIFQTTVLPDCHIEVFKNDLPTATDPTIMPQWVPLNQNGACPIAQDGAIFYSGQRISGGSGVYHVSFEYY